MTTITIPDLSGLPQAAEAFLKAIGSRKVVAFYAAMGSGKTTFISALAACLGVEDAVNSPTFSILNEYLSATGEPVYHFDFYRLHSSDEAIDLGFEDYFYSNRLCLIEWPEIVEDILPADCVRVRIAVNEDQSRILSFE